MTTPGTDTAGPGGQPDPDAIVAAVRACPLVAGLSGGLAGEVATYLPGRRVTGVQLRPEGVAVHVVGRYGPTIAEIAAEVTAAVAAVAGPVPVWVRIDDLDVPPSFSTRPPAAVSPPTSAQVR